MPGNTLPNRTTLIELHSDGSFTEDRVVVRNEHCEEGYDDDEEVAEEQKREAREVQDRG